MTQRTTLHRCVPRAVCALVLLGSGCTVELNSPLDAGSSFDSSVGTDGGTPGDPWLPQVDGAVAPGVDTGLPPWMPESDAGGGVADAAVVPDASTTPQDPETGRLLGITAAHNAARARAPAMPPLPPVTWAPEMAVVAQAYAEKLAATCQPSLVHSTAQERHGWGENLAFFGASGGFGGAAGSAQQAVDGWESELSCYTFGAFQSGVNSTCSSACSSYGGCGHYTQLVWRNTQRIGCGEAECTSGRSTYTYWVCNYDPPGNYIGQLPY